MAGLDGYVRSNTLLSKDATPLDYSSILERFPRVIDYLSLDVDGYYDTVLKRVMQSNHIFKIITNLNNGFQASNNELSSLSSFKDGFFA